MGIDSENHLFRNLPKALSCKIERSIYNRRKRRLSEQINNIRLKLAKEFNEFKNCFIVDIMPLEVCEITRINHSKFCKEHQFCAPNRGFSASQQLSFYGYKLHAVCFLRGVF
ncbi:MULTISPECIES: hypothetical protein [Empedobacter]|uniref:hypothetical protein n=1 Tax=Empedobacter TaxID=59734 RepID=UPI002575C3FF|nr:hypothetical protein [Empedobacter sp. R132-2]MDM1138365.1 hypothetical protein [Empedobacter sp. R132-2]